MVNSESNTGKILTGKYLKVIIMNIAVILAATALIFLGSVASAGHALLSAEVFPEGTKVDGVDLSGLTLDEGREVIGRNNSRRLDGLSVEFDYCENTVVLSAKELYLSYDTEAALNQLTNADASGGGLRLFEYIETVFTPKHENGYSAPLVYDGDKTIAALEAALSPFDKAPENAQAVFNKAEAEISYAKEISGRKVNAPQVAEDIIAHVESGKSSPLVVEYDTVEAEVTQAELRESTALIGECETLLPDNENSIINLQLACDSVNGSSIREGETLSLNELLGERTAEKGYTPAPVIDGTEFVDGIGGGICQLAGTLYVAAMNADMEIVERVNHTYPSTYLPVGLDATVNWDDKDLKIKNRSSQTVYVSAVIDTESNTLTVSLYGQRHADGFKIEIVPEVIREFAPGGEIVEFTNSLPPGQREVIEPARTGYEVSVYRNYYHNNELTKSELVSSDTYSSKPATVLVGADSNNK